MLRLILIEAEKENVEETKKEMKEGERRKESLQDIKQEFQQILDAVCDGIRLVDIDSTIIRANRAMEYLFSGISESIVGRKCYEVCKCSDCHTNACSLQRVLNGEHHFTTEEECVFPDGGKILCCVTTSAFHSPDGKVSGMIQNFKDITERKEAEQRLQHHENFLKNALDALTHPFYVINVKDYTVQLANKAARFNDNRKDRTCYSLTHNRSTPCSGNDHPCTLSEVLKTKQPVVAEHIHYDDSGQEQHVEVHAYPILDASGNVVQVIEYCLDISKRMKLELQLRQAQKMEAIGTLAGGIAHDFNNILTAVLGYAQLAKFNLPGGSQAASDIDDVIKAGLLARDLVRQILTFSRNSEQNLQPIQVQSLVKEALKLLRSAIPTSIEIRHNIDQTCGPVIADLAQIQQVLMNLCTNSYHAMRDKGGVLDVSMAPMEFAATDKTEKLSLKPGPYIRLTVSDTGHGMDSKMVERIFEPYFTTKRAGEGTGLGLSVVHGIVKDIGGHITVFSEPDIGTTFHIYLPEQRPKERLNGDKKISGLLPGGSERILLIDDKAEIVRSAQGILQRLGYSVDGFTDCEEGKDAFLKNPEQYDLIISDMTMPRTSGAELAQLFLSVRADIPIIICTGFSESINQEKAREIGVKRLVMKPMTASELARTIRQVLDTTPEE